MRRVRFSRQSLHRFFLAAALALISATALAEELRLAVSRGPVSLPIYVAESHGLFAREGVAVRLHDCSSGRECTELMAKGQADLATAAELLTTLHSLKGGDSAIIATLSSSSQHIKLVARRGAGIRVPADMRGKRVATVGGTSAQYFLDTWLLYHEIDPGEVSASTLPPEQLVTALKRHDVDAIAIWEPLAAQAIAALADESVVLPSPRIYTQHFNLVASRAALQHRQAELMKLLRALDAAERFIAAEPAVARKALQPWLPADTAGSHLHEHDFSLALTHSLIATMDGQARWAARLGLVAPGAPANLLRSIEPGLLRKVAPLSVSLVH